MPLVGTELAAFLTMVDEHLALVRSTAHALGARGDDIDAACGQLAGDVQDRTGIQARIQKQRSIPIQPVFDATSKPREDGFHD